jgi:predicted RNA-binding Zn-ribbon protein involved in translation (DUF1610 family)
MQVVDETREYHCVGCGLIIPWDGRDALAYTCQCGANLIANNKGEYSLPTSLLLGLKKPHIDHYLGISNYCSSEKNRAYEQLKKLGCTWTWECEDEKCRINFLRMKKMQKHAGYIKFQLHPDLDAILEKIKICQTCEEDIAEYKSLETYLCKKCAKDAKVCTKTNKLKF